MNVKERQEAVNEIRILASIGGPYNIRFLEAFVDADILYIVTEFAANGDLFGWIKARKNRGPIKESVVWSLLLQMCHGLQSLHEKNILHRDLKSANVFMMSEKHVKLGDFGVAKVLKTDDALARTQVGTPYYVAPEVWKNKPYNSKCDVWSLGCLLYELLTFRPPFDSNSMDGLARKVLRGKYDPIPAMYSDDMRHIVARLLVVEQRDRPSVDQILSDPVVQRHLDAMPPLDDAQPPMDEPVDIMKTIHVPRKFTDLTQNLPPSRYVTPRPGNKGPGTDAGPAAAAPSSGVEQRGPRNGPVPMKAPVMPARPPSGPAAPAPGRVIGNPNLRVPQVWRSHRGAVTKEARWVSRGRRFHRRLPPPRHRVPQGRARTPTDGLGRNQCASPTFHRLAAGHRCTRHRPSAGHRPRSSVS